MSIYRNAAFGLGVGAGRGAAIGLGTSILTGAFMKGDQSQVGGTALGAAGGMGGMFLAAKGLGNHLDGRLGPKRNAAMMLLGAALPFIGGYIGSTRLGSNQPRNKIKSTMKGS